MIHNNRNFHRHIQVSLLILICIFTLLSGCSKAEPDTEGSTPSVESPTTTESNKNNITEQPNSQSDVPGSETEGLPAGVKITKVINEETLKNDAHKKVELLTDGGKRITITDSNDEIIMRHLDYEGVILTANGNEVTVQVEDGGQQTLNIPNQLVIEDDEKLGLNKGVEIEWEVNTDGQIQSVELDD